MKNKYIAAILGIFGGCFGMHHFYLGSTYAGLVEICLLFGTMGMSVIFSLAEGVMLLFVSTEKFNEVYNETKPKKLEFVFQRIKFDMLSISNAFPDKDSPAIQKLIPSRKTLIIAGACFGIMFVGLFILGIHLQGKLSAADELYAEGKQEEAVETYLAMGSFVENSDQSMSNLCEHFAKTDDERLHVWARSIAEKDAPVLVKGEYKEEVLAAVNKAKADIKAEEAARKAAEAVIAERERKRREEIDRQWEESNRRWREKKAAEKRASNAASNERARKVLDRALKNGTSINEEARKEYGGTCW